MMTNSEIHPRIVRWIEMVERGEIPACKEQYLLVAYVRRAFATEDIYVDHEMLEKYIGLARYFPIESLYPWEEFCTALHLATFWRETGMPRWPDLFLLIGRGAGKDIFIAYEALCVTSPYSRLSRYDVDICANTGEQANRPVEDLVLMLEDRKNYAKLKRHYYWTKEKVQGLKYGGVVRGRTNNPKNRDGMRSGMVVFNEIHQYPDYANIKVFISGKGKTKHPRELYATTNGEVREGPLDSMLERAGQILAGDIPDNGLLPFICRLDDKQEALNPELWPKANPSLPYNQGLEIEIRKEFKNWQDDPIANSDFMTKRMNLPAMVSDVRVTNYEHIQATKEPLPDLKGLPCVAGIDYVKLGDWASVNLRFKKDGKKFDINHSWMCLKSKDLERIQAPWREWAEAGMITLVDDVEVHPTLITNWLFEAGKKYDIRKLALDNYRYALLAYHLEQIGFDAKERKNVHLVRPSDIMSIVPVIDSDFLNHRLVWGDYPPLRWATNNAKLVRSSKKIGADTGNYYYAKIEGRSRKTDPFMAMVASVVIEDELGTGESTFDDLPVIVG